MAVRAGYFTVQSFDPDYTFHGEFGDEAPTPTSDSYGGWSVTEIPKRMGLTEWAGRPPMGVEISFLIDRLEEGDGEYVEEQRDIIEKIAATHSRDSEPPICIVDTGGLMPHDYTHARHVRWVVESLAWDKGLTINSNYSLRPLRVGGLLTFRQYNHDDILENYQGPAANHRDRNKSQPARSKGKPSKSSYTVRAGDTLGGIAARVLGDSKSWRKIAQANNIRDPRSIRVGQVLRIPK